MTQSTGMVYTILQYLKLCNFLEFEHYDLCDAVYLD